MFTFGREEISFNRIFVCQDRWTLFCTLCEQVCLSSKAEMGNDDGFKISDPKNDGVECHIAFSINIQFWPFSAILASLKPLTQNLANDSKSAPQKTMESSTMLYFW